jgi:ABC-type sugar transport system ATPase subunit
MDGGRSGLAVEGLTLSRRGARVLHSITFAAEQGRLLAILGPSGAGKSSLLAAIAGFEAPDSGENRCNGRPTAQRPLGFAFDDAALHEHLTVAENLFSAAVPRREPRTRTNARVASLAASLGIAHILERKPAAISAGERRRAAVGRAFIRAPELVLLDEPFANLDRGNRFAIRQIIRELQRTTDATVVLVTHDPTDALAIADETLVLVEGRARALGPSRAVAAFPADLEVAQLVDDLGMHVIALDPNGGARDCSIPADIAARARAEGELLLGISPWHVEIGQADPGALGIRGRLVAIEPAGSFTDIIAVRADNRALRARIPAAHAQELPIGSSLALRVRRDAVQLYGGPWPGRRLG